VSRRSASENDGTRPPGRFYEVEFAVNVLLILSGIGPV